MNYSDFERFITVLTSTRTFFVEPFGASAEEILEIEEWIGRQLPTDLRWFLEKFGALSSNGFNQVMGVTSIQGTRVSSILGLTDYASEFGNFPQEFLAFDEPDLIHAYSCINTITGKVHRYFHGVWDPKDEGDFLNFIVNECQDSSGPLEY